MRRLVLVLSAALLAGCAKKEAPPAEQAPAAAPSIDVASLAGTWNLSGTMAGDTNVVVTGTITATADPAGWTITLPNRPAMPLSVTVSGDSLLTASGPYESVLRKGVQVTTNGVLHLVNGQLVGTNTAHYAVTTADSVAQLQMTATKAP
jgi:hypothetical protein